MKMRTVAVMPIVAIAVLSLAACGGGKSSNTNAQGAGNTSGSPSAAGQVMRTGAVPNCGATQAVWVNLKTRVYHEPSDPAYGKTKHGEYLCPAQAASEGFRAAGGTRRGRHHKHATQT